jgi:hypothetical protein
VVVVRLLLLLFKTPKTFKPKKNMDWQQKIPREMRIAYPRASQHGEFKNPKSMSGR